MRSVKRKRMDIGSFLFYENSMRNATIFFSFCPLTAHLQPFKQKHPLLCGCYKSPVELGIIF